MNKKNEQLIGEVEQQLYPEIIADMSDAERARFRQWEWLSLCRSLFCGPVKLGPVRTPEGRRDDLYDVIREAQAILS